MSAVSVSEFCGKGYSRRPCKGSSAAVIPTDCHFEPIKFDFQRTAHLREILLIPSIGRTTHMVEISRLRYFAFGSCAALHLRHDIWNAFVATPPPWGRSRTGFYLSETAPAKRVMRSPHPSHSVRHLPQRGRQDLDHASVATPPPPPCRRSLPPQRGRPSIACLSPNLFRAWATQFAEPCRLGVR